MGRRHLLAATTLYLLALGSASPAALAAPRTRVSWQLPVATAGSPTSVNWSVSHQLPGSVVVIQRPVGTARVWRTLLRLSGTHGTASLPAYPLGSYRLRLAVIAGPQVLAQRQRILHVFGKVALAKLLDDDPIYKGVYATPTASFAYDFWYDNLVNGMDQGVISVEHNPCESVSLEFAIGNPNPGYPANDFAGDVGTVTVVQQTRDPVSASAPFNGLNSFTAGVVPGQSWSINLSESGPTAGEFGFYFYLNGSAVCDSTAVPSL
jgi:hypothetical protein